MKRPDRSRRESAPELSMAPLGAGSTQRGGVSWEPDAQAYLFQAEEVRYRVLVDEEPAGEEEAAAAGLLRIEGRIGDEAPWVPLLTSAGMLFREAEGAVLPPTATHQRCALQELRHSCRGRAVSLKYIETVDGNPLKRSLQVRLAGRTLEIAVEGPGGQPGEGFCGFSLGRVGPEGARQVTIPGLPDPLVILDGEGFLSAYPERYRGKASDYPPGGAFYREDTEGRTAPIAETFYVTLSAYPLDPLPGLTRPPAPFRSDLEGRVTLDYYSEAPYADDDRLLRLLPLYGLRDVTLIYRNWQQFGYERRGPLLYPANADRGGNEEFRNMLGSAMYQGWLVTLRQEYATAMPDSPYWSEKVLATWPDGQPRLSHRPGQYGIAAQRMLEFARLEATQIARNYPVGGAFVDGHTAWNPEGYFRQVDAQPNSASGTESQAIRQVELLLTFLRDVHEGPIIGAAGDGPARFDTFTRGMAEAVLRGPDGGRTAPLIVDYELQEVRGGLLGIGAGSYRQFCGHPTGEPVEASRVDWDAYRATEIALGHAGYVGNYRIKPGPRGIPFPGGSAATMVREYYLLRALQELYLSVPVRAIYYRDRGDHVGLSEALRRGLDLSQAQLTLEYENGLTVWVNRSNRERWDVATHEGRYELPASGWLALSPEHGFIAYTAQVGNGRADFCRCDQYTFLDTRSGSPRTVEGISVDGAVVLSPGIVAEWPDVLLVAARQLTIDEDEYRLSDRGDARLVHLSHTELELTVMDTDTGKPIHVSWPTFNEAWKGTKFEVLEYSDRAWRPSRCQVQQTRNGPQISRVLPGVTYRICVPE